MEGPLAILHSRSFNRYRPYGLEKVRLDNLRFVMFWGALGKTKADEKDLQAIGLLAKFHDEIELKTGKTAKFTILLADKHAEMNGISWVDLYLAEISKLITDAGFEAKYVSEMWEKYAITFEAINNGKMNVAVKNPKLTAFLKHSASRHFSDDAEDGWKLYYAMRSLEKDMLEKEFADCIFLTYNNPEYRELLPELPTLYIYANNGSRPPWLPE